MRTRRREALVPLLLAAGLAAPGCTGGDVGPGDALTDPGIEIVVAPLELPGVTNASYTVTVANGRGETVWTRAVDSVRYGDGAGGLSLVGPCDASEPEHTVALVLDSLEGAGGVIDPATYRNPTVPTAITRAVTCAEGADTRVTFDLTIARDAGQGFFDVAVSFDDIFCSAKLDCGATTDPADDIELLFHDGARDMTAILGLACTGGPGADTHLYLDDVEIRCGGVTTAVVDVGGQGNVDLAAPPSDNAAGYLFAAQVTRGSEGLANKIYWNVALGLDEASFPAAECRLTTAATASAGPLPGLTTGAGATYPVLRWDVALSAGGARVCTLHQVDAAPAGVATAYATAPDGVAFQHGASLPTGCTSDAQCSDGDPCTQDVCVAGGACVFHDCALAGYACPACEATVYESCSDLVGTGLPDGVYTVDPDGAGGLDPFDVWCDADQGWTLIDSFAFGNNSADRLDFASDLPLNEDDPSHHALHRLSLARMQALEGVSTEWLASCDLDTSQTDDFLRGDLTALTPTTTTGNPHCATLDAASIRGHACTNCSVPMYQWAGLHLTTSTGTECGTLPWFADATTSEDDFGWYGNYNTAFSCVATAESTTNWWLRTRVCEPSTTGCLDHRVVTCDATGTGYTVVADCAAQGDSCVGGACVDYVASCGELVGQGLPDGVYTIDPDGGGVGVDPFEVWCDLTRGWTLIESVSRDNYIVANPSDIRRATFAVDLPLNAADPTNHALHRLSKAQIQALEGASSEWMATCNMDTAEQLDFMRFEHADVRLTTFSGTGVCFPSVAANIRGHGCTGCTVPLWQAAGTYHLVTDSYLSTCGARPWNTGAVYSEDNFGYYGVHSTAFSCVATGNSTTNYWVRDLACTPGARSCVGTTVHACNSLGTFAAPTVDCADSGQICVDGGSCEAYDPGSENQPVASCSALYGLGLTADGVYWIDPDGAGGVDKTQVWCDLSGGGWTLVESFSYANAASFTGSALFEDQPENVTAPDVFARHRLPLAQMQALEGVSTEWLATCDMDTSMTRDYLHGTVAALSPTAFNAANTCAEVLAADVRGYACSGCRVPFWQASSYHLHTDASNATCEALPWTGTAVSSEDAFGYYQTTNPAFSCVDSSDSTTQWWMRTRVCEPNSVQCDGDLARQCDPYGTSSVVAQDCAALGESCWEGACAALPATCNDKVGSGDPDGVYPIDPDGPGGAAPFEVWCDVDNGWTLIESASFGNNGWVYNQPYQNDLPLNEGDPANHALHRLSRAKMVAIEAASTEWMATCNMDTSGEGEFVQVTTAALSPTTFSANGVCVPVIAGDLRGYGCSGCVVAFWQNHSSVHMVTDSSVGCGANSASWVGTGVASEDDFGYYGVYNTAHGCVSSAASTTNYWMR